MCLSMPAKLLKKDGLQGRADADGNEVEVDLSLVPDAAVGDYVLIHAGLAIELYDEQEALDTLDMLREALGEAPESL